MLQTQQTLFTAEDQQVVARALDGIEGQESRREPAKADRLLGLMRADLAYRPLEQILAPMAVDGKELVASMGDVAASGGYYAAMGADQVFANPTTVTGTGLGGRIRRVRYH